MLTSTDLDLARDSPWKWLIVELACANRFWTSMASEEVVIKGPILVSVAPSQLSCSASKVSTSCPACATAIFNKYGNTPTFSALSSASSTRSGCPDSKAVRKRVVEDAMKESCKKKCSNCSGLSRGMSSTRVSIIASSLLWHKDPSTESACPIATARWLKAKRRCSSSGEICVPWALMSWMAAVSEWQPRHAFERIVFSW
mmetsp:Transcript_32052/g.91424  ORF Transcript_32052/g.91424 Transcript_32052/m.91424 type:complete len:200 (+) Transcript_32052:1174-1773(+)